MGKITFDSDSDHEEVGQQQQQHAEAVDASHATTSTADGTDEVAYKSKKKKGSASSRSTKKISDDLEVGASYRGQIVRMVEKGVFIKLKGVSAPDGFCHISMLSDKYVTDVEKDRWVHVPGDGTRYSKPTLGLWVRPRVIDIDRKKNRFTLSLQPEKMRAKEEEAVAKHYGRGKVKPPAAAAAAMDTSETGSGGGGEGGGASAASAASATEGGAATTTNSGKRKRSAEKQAARNARRLAKKAAATAASAEGVGAA